MEMGHSLRNRRHRVLPPPEPSSGAIGIRGCTDDRQDWVSRSSYIGHLTGGEGGGVMAATDMLASGISSFLLSELNSDSEERSRTALGEIVLFFVFIGGGDVGGGGGRNACKRHVECGYRDDGYVPKW